MLMPVLMASHDKEGHVAPHFNNFDGRNAVVTLMMLLVLHVLTQMQVA